MENKNMFAIWSFNDMTDIVKFHGIAPRNWLAREAIEKLAVKYMDELTDRGIRPIVRWGRNETSVTVSYGLKSKTFYFELITIGEIKP